MDAKNPDAEEKTDTLFHRAASFAIYSIVTAILLQLVYSQIWLRLQTSAIRLAGFIPAIVIISAIPAGFIALCGIPRYGIRKLLWKGLVGVILPIGLFIFSVYYSAYLRNRIIEETQKMEQKK